MFFSLCRRESPPQRKPAVILFFSQVSGTIQRLEICPDMWENVQPEGLRGKIQSWMEIFKGPRILIKLALWLSLCPIEEMLHT